MPATVVLWGAFCVVGQFVRKTGRFTDKCHHLAHFLRKTPSFTDKLIPKHDTIASYCIVSVPLTWFRCHGPADLVSLTAATSPKFCPVRRDCCEAQDLADVVLPGSP